MKSDMNKQSQLAKLIKLPDIFSGRCFIIPDYQRGFAWESSQVSALLEDIEHLERHEHVHFTGTIVLNHIGETSKGTKMFEIVDGQQRLTTLIILISILLKKVTDEKARDQYSDSYMMRGDEGNKERVFCLNSHVDQYFKEKVIDHREECKNEEFISEVLIKSAYKIIDKWIDKQTNAGFDADCILKRIFSYLGFIVYQPDDNKEVGMMFEVINNRGKPLTELEKVKNYLIYYAIKNNKTNLQKNVDTAWGEILKNLASAHHLKKPDEKLFLRSAVITYLGFGKEDSQKIYDTLKKTYPINGAKEGSWKELEGFVEFLRRASLYYEALMNEDSLYRKNNLKDSQKIVEQIELIRSQTSHAAILPTYFALMDKKSGIDKNELLDIFRMLECANFRVYMSRNGAKRSDSGQAELFYRANMFYRNFDDAEWLKKECEVQEVVYKSHAGYLIGALYDFVDDNAPDNSFVKGLRLQQSDKDDFYAWRGLKYFLMNYEREINKKRTIKVENIIKNREGKLSNDIYSIEHIWATSNVVKGARKKTGADGFHKRRLGNFSLLELGINIQAYNKGIEEKIEIYNGKNSDTDSSVLKQIKFLIMDFNVVKKNIDSKRTRRTGKYYEVLNVETINRFEDRLIKFAKNRWSTKWAECYWD